MLRIGSLLRILLTVILVGIPLSMGLYYLGKRSLKLGKFLLQKVNEVKALDTMRQEILQKRVQESKEEKIRDEFDKDIIDTKKDIFLPEIKEEVATSGPIHTQKIELEAKEKKLLEKIVYESLALKKEGKLDQYEKKIIEGLAIDSTNKDLNQMLADLYFTMGNHNKALSLLKKIIEIDSQNHNAIWQLGEIYLITGDFETSELLVEKAISMSPSNPKYYISLVEIYYNTERIKESLNIMEKVVRLRPTNANYIYTLANLYEEIEDVDSAKKYYFRVLECEPSNEKAKKKLKNLA